MAEKANIMTHEDFAGKKPTVNLRFPVIWKNTGREGDDVRENDMSVISTPNVRDWESFKRDLVSLNLLIFSIILFFPNYTIRPFVPRLRNNLDYKQ